MYVLLTKPRHRSQVCVQSLFERSAGNVWITSVVQWRSDHRLYPYIGVYVTQSRSNSWPRCPIIFRVIGGVQGKPQPARRLVVVQGASTSFHGMQACISNNNERILTKQHMNYASEKGAVVLDSPLSRISVSGAKLATISRREKSIPKTSFRCSESCSSFPFSGGPFANLLVNNVFPLRSKT